MKIDAATRDAITSATREAVREAMEIYNERWLTADELIAQFGFFTKDWLKRYGDTLPRERFEVVDADGEHHATRWAYPQHRIQRWIEERRHTQLHVSGRQIDQALQQYRGASEG